MKLKDKLLGLIGLSVAGLMMFSCTEVKEANYQIIPMPLDIQLEIGRASCRERV